MLCHKLVPSHNMALKPCPTELVLTTFFRTGWRPENVEQVQSFEHRSPFRKIVARPGSLYYIQEVCTQFEPGRTNVLSEWCIRCYYDMKQQEQLNKHNRFVLQLYTRLPELWPDIPFNHIILCHCTNQSLPYPINVKRQARKWRVSIFKVIGLTRPWFRLTVYQNGRRMLNSVSHPIQMH